MARKVSMRAGCKARRSLDCNFDVLYAGEHVELGHHEARVAVDHVGVHAQSVTRDGGNKGVSAEGNTDLRTTRSSHPQRRPRPVVVPTSLPT